jgi:rfaE bifunctional protein kinase chain/domain
MTANKIKNIFKSFNDKKILVIGDVMVDAYLWGRVERISPEAPVPVVSCTKHESRLGGAANVALNIQALGATPYLCGLVGNNDAGTQFLKIMQEYHLDNSCIHIVAGRPTTVKTRIISGNQQLIRIDEETDKPLTEKDEDDFIQHILSVIQKYRFDAIIYQDYDKGAITPKLINTITQKANDLGIVTLVDPKKRNFLNYESVSFFKPNYKEFIEGIKADIVKGDFEQLFEVAKKFQIEKNIKYVMVTLSELGVFISTTEAYYHIPAHIRDIADVSGAGDTVISVASLALVCGLTPPNVAAIANLAGGLVCEKVGVVPIEKNKLEEEAQLLNFKE